MNWAPVLLILFGAAMMSVGYMVEISKRPEKSVNDMPKNIRRWAFVAFYVLITWLGLTTGVTLAFIFQRL